MKSYARIRGWPAPDAAVTAPVVGHAVSQAVALTRECEPQQRPSRTVYEPTLVVRDSTAPPARP
jgi:hypothetical protein